MVIVILVSKLNQYINRIIGKLYAQAIIIINHYTYRLIILIILIILHRLLLYIPTNLQFELCVLTDPGSCTELYVHLLTNQ